MKRRRVNRLVYLVPAIAAGILMLGWIFESLSISRGVSAPSLSLAGGGAVGPADAGFADYYRTGVHLLQIRRPGAAAGMFERARALRPQQPEVHVNLGFAYFDLGDYGRAEDSFRAALDRNPGQVNAYYGLAESLEATGDLAGALGAMRTFIHLAPAEDGYVRRARAAVWEWSATLALRRQSGDAPDRAPSAVASANGIRIAADRLDGALELTRLNGTVDRFGDYSGKTVILNVWATWCPPCRAELPSLQSLQEQLGDERFAVVGLSIDEDGDFVREFLRETGVRYPNYLDGEERVSEQILEVNSYPQTLLVAADGTIVERIVGAREWARPEMVERIRNIAAPADRNTDASVAN